MVTGIFLFCMIVVMLAIMSNVKSLNKHKNNILFGVTLPSCAFDNDEVKKLQKRYSKDLTIIMLIFALLVLPFLYPSEYISIKLLYLVLWIAGLIYMAYLPYRRNNKKLANLKKLNNWLVGSKRTAIDLRVSRLKASTVVPSVYFIPSIIIAIVLLLNSNSRTIVLYSIAFVLNCIFFIIYKLFIRMRSKVYSHNSDINLAINLYTKRKWSIAWLIVAYISTINVLCLTPFMRVQGNYSMIIFINSILPLAILVTFIYTVKSIRNHEASLIEDDKERYIVDDDAYWIQGLFYNNPNDQSFMVEKRAGIGSTLNLATRRGKIFTYGTCVLVIIIVVAVLLFSFVSDFVDPIMVFNEDHSVDVVSMLYGYEFLVEDIQNLELIDTIPEGSKTNGAATDRYARGNFSLENYGKTKLYVFKKKPPFILIKLKDLYIIYNEKEPEKTKALYDELLNQMKRN